MLLYRHLSNLHSDIWEMIFPRRPFLIFRHHHVQVGAGVGWTWSEWVACTYEFVKELSNITFKDYWERLVSESTFVTYVHSLKQGPVRWWFAFPMWYLGPWGGPFPAECFQTENSSIFFSLISIHSHPGIPGNLEGNDSWRLLDWKRTDEFFIILKPFRL